MTPEEFEQFLLNETDYSISKYCVTRIVKEVASIIFSSSMDRELLQRWVDVATDVDND